MGCIASVVVFMHFRVKNSHPPHFHFYEQMPTSCSMEEVVGLVSVSVASSIEYKKRMAI